MTVWKNRRYSWVKKDKCEWQRLYILDCREDSWSVNIFSGYQLHKLEQTFTISETVSVSKTWNVCSKLMWWSSKKILSLSLVVKDSSCEATELRIHSQYYQTRLPEVIVCCWHFSAQVMTLIPNITKCRLEVALCKKIWRKSTAQSNI